MRARGVNTVGGGGIKWLVDKGKEGGNRWLEREGGREGIAGWREREGGRDD